MIPLRSYVGLLASHLARQRRRVVLMSTALSASTALLLLNPQLTRLFIDRALDGRPLADLVPLAVAFIVIALCSQALAVVGAHLSQVVGWTATNELRMELASHVLGLDMRFHKRRTPGELIERIDGDVAVLANFFSAFAVRVVANALLLVGILGLLWLEHPLIGLSATAFATASFAAMTRAQRWAVPRWDAVRTSAAEFYGFAGEQLMSTEDIKANGGDPFMMRRVTVMLARWLPRQVAGWHGHSLLWSVTTVAHNLGLALIFVLGARLLAGGALSLGSVYLVFTYMSMAARPMERIRNQIADLQKAGAGIERIQRLLATESALVETGTRPLADGPLQVSLRHVTFAYDDGEHETDADRAGAPSDVPVLVDLSLDLAAGAVLGVLGRTGCGKTTAARLLTRLYDPTAGTVALNGVPLAEIDPASLRQRVGMVTQDVQLFGASVRDNLTFFDPEIPDEAILATLDTLGLDHWLRTLPAGLDTELSSGGGGLSAGQAQLLAFARVFLRNPGLVILDEASSRLDPATEQLIERAVDHLLTDRTAIIIAHRLATVTRADQILILDAGRVVEHGPRLELLADPTSIFNRLLATGLEEVLA